MASSPAPSPVSELIHPAVKDAGGWKLSGESSFKGCSGLKKTTLPKVPPSSWSQPHPMTHQCRGIKAPLAHMQTTRKSHPSSSAPYRTGSCDPRGGCSLRTNSVVPSWIAGQPTPAFLSGEFKWQWKWMLLWEPLKHQKKTMPKANTRGQHMEISYSVSRGQKRRRQWHPTPALLPGESQGRGSLVGCRLWGRTESDTTEAT